MIRLLLFVVVGAWFIPSVGRDLSRRWGVIHYFPSPHYTCVVLSRFVLGRDSSRSATIYICVIDHVGAWFITFRVENGARDDLHRWVADVINHAPTMGCIMPMVAQADVINHVPADESRNDGNIKMPAFPWATTKVAVWKGRLDVLCQMRS